MSEQKLKTSVQSAKDLADPVMTVCDFNINNEIKCFTPASSSLTTFDEFKSKITEINNLIDTFSRKVRNDAAFIIDVAEALQKTDDQLSETINTTF